MYTSESHNYLYQSIYRIPEIRLHCPETPVVLCASKIDIRDDPDVIKKLKDNNLKPITTEQGIELAKQQKCIAYVENSAKTQKGLKKTFELLLAAASYRPVVKQAKKKEKCALQ